MSFSSFYNFHPVLTTFPFALLSVVVLLELWAAFRASDKLQFVISLNLVVACLGIGFAFLSGYQASELANKTFVIPDDVISQHHSYGRLALFLTAPCLALKYFSLKATYNRQGFRFAYLGFLALIYAFTIMTGYLGAELVFSYGAGVKATAGVVP